jgi:hypothetical protein
MNLKESVFSIFSGLSRLYPKEYQQNYSEDMKSVFLDILEDSGDAGSGHALRSLLREFVCLPACLFREYFLAKGDDRMKSTRQVISATVFGFLSMYFLLGLGVGMLVVFFGLDNLQSTGIEWLILLTAGVLYGILVGGAIGFALSIKNKAVMMFTCGLAFLAPHVILSPEALGLPNPWKGEGWSNFLFYASAPICGFCFGMLVGFLWKGWKTGIAFGLAGALVETIGFGIFHAFQDPILHQGLDWIVFANTLSEKLRVLIYYSASYMFYGGIVGILWGILLDRLPRIKSLKLSGASA